MTRNSKESSRTYGKDKIQELDSKECLQVWTNDAYGYCFEECFAFLGFCYDCYPCLRNCLKMVPKDIWKTGSIEERYQGTYGPTLTNRRGKKEGRREMARMI